MIRRISLIALTLVLAVALGGCQGKPATGGKTTSGSTSDAPSPSGGATATTTTGPDAMAADGPGESAAVAAIPAALTKAKQMRADAGMQWPDLSGIQPQFTAYIVAVDMSGQTALFEVRADGQPHNLYAYQRAFDAGTIIWTPSENAGTARKPAQSVPEKAAVSAVESVMKDAFPDATFSVNVYGYRFSYQKDDATLLNLELATDGSVISAGS